MPIAGELATVRDDVSGAIRGISLLLVFGAVVLMVVAYPFGAVFQTSFQAASGIGNVIIAFVLGLPGFSALFVVQRTFYALDDTRTPFFFTLFQVVLFSILSFLCLLLPVQWIAVGVALATTVAGAAQLIVAVVLLQRKLGSLDGRRISVALGRSLLALVLPAAAGVFLLVLLGGTSDGGGYAVSSRIGAIMTMAIIAVVMSALYFGGLWALRSPELRTVAEPLVARIRRR